MLLLVTVISIGAWAQYLINSTTIEGVNSKMLKGNQQSYEINYKVKYDENTYLEEEEDYTVSVTFSNGNPVNDGSIIKPDGTTNKLIVSMDTDKKYTLVKYILNIISPYDPTDTQTASFSVVRFEGDSPFVVSDSEEPTLNRLAECVKNGITFEGEFFKLGKDLSYNNTANNYVPIGSFYEGKEKPFKGSFDGCGHTIKGVNINSSTDDIGLFGFIGNGGEVKNLTLDKSSITGNNLVGGIVGYNQGGTITNCHVTSSVTVTGNTTKNTPERFGGIVGNNGSNGTISNCSSAVTLSNAEQYSGGIAGYNEPGCTLSHNLVIGATIPTNNESGAILGYNEDDPEKGKGILAHNYYTGCGSQKGCSGEDVEENDGAVPLAVSGTTIILYDSGSKANENTTTISQNIGKHNVVLAGRTLYKDGDWNTLCLPFDVTINGSVLSGADARTLSTTAFDSTTGTLTLDFTPSPEEAGSVTSLTAGTPYIIKWSNGENLVNPVFTDVTIASFVQEGTAADFSHAVETNYAKFIGTYSPTGIYTSPAVNLYLGANNTLYYPSATKNINAFRAYFQLLNGLTAGDPESGLHVRAFSLNFDDDPTGIITTDYMDDMDKDGAWYGLDGRKYSAKPTAKGLYINKGKKVVIK